MLRSTISTEKLDTEVASKNNALYLVFYLLSNEDIVYAILVVAPDTSTLHLDISPLHHNPAFLIICLLYRVIVCQIFISLAIYLSSYGFPMESLWLPSGIPVESLWVPNGIPFGFPGGSLWIPHGFPVGSLWVPHGILMGYL